MRGKRVKKRTIKPDIKYNSPTVSKLINYVMVDGKKGVSEKIIYSYLEELSTETKLKPAEALEKVLETLKPKVEVKSRRVGGANYQVPVPVTENRQETLALRWLIDASRSNRGGKPFYKSLLSESLATINKEGMAYKKREDTHRMAEANKAFSHLSW